MIVSGSGAFRGRERTEVEDVVVKRRGARRGDSVRHRPQDASTCDDCVAHSPEKACTVPKLSNVVRCIGLKALLGLSISIGGEIITRVHDLTKEVPNHCTASPRHSRWVAGFGELA